MSKIAPEKVEFKVLEQLGHDSGFLTKACTFVTDLKEDAVLDVVDMKASLKNGRLHIKYGTIWDFASGAIDTDDMKVASLPHDVLCRMHQEGLISWKSRRRADRVFRKVLLEKGCSPFRAWYAYCAVTAISYWQKVK